MKEDKMEFPETTTQNKENKIEFEFPECPICLDIYSGNEKNNKAPKFLGCGDSLCKDCLQKYINKNNDSEYLKCPRCTKQIIKKLNADDYATNKDIIRVINSLFNIQGLNEKNEGQGPITYNIISLVYLEELQKKHL